MFFLTACSKETNSIIIDPVEKNLTIFITNDIHGSIDNFAKVKYLVDEEKKKTNVLLTNAGDIFSGNPIVDNYPEKGFPIIDLMNRVGYDISVIGNHEFDYGETNLKDRMQQANFKWVCANVETSASVIPQPSAFTNITIDDIKVSFLGLVETDGKENDIIPSTHPWRVKNLTFQNPEDVVNQYKDLKAEENADLYIALTHIGHSKQYSLGDFQLATQFPYFDLIIGGHSNGKIDTVVNKIPVFQAGNNLDYIGKIELTIEDKKVININYQLINLNTVTEEDSDIKKRINDYNDAPFFKEVIGSAQVNHNKDQVGNFAADALRLQMKVDVAFQNNGGVRSILDDGDITKKEIYQILPFNNPMIVYEMTVAEIKNFLIGSGAGFYYAGVIFENNNNRIIVKDLNGNTIPDNTTLTVGVNDYVPAVYDLFFPTPKNINPETDAETVIDYLKHTSSEINYSASNNFFRY
ncbi:5'-nucleotidase [Polaribacter sp. Hel1_85]|nr:5'-nucleotidase [Polaribacter sp. Hel1_85]